MWRSDFEPILHVVWVDSQLHGKALTVLVAANQRGISLTDWTSFELMREQAIEELLLSTLTLPNRVFVPSHEV